MNSFKRQPIMSQNEQREQKLICHILNQSWGIFHIKFTLSNLLPSKWNFNWIAVKTTNNDASIAINKITTQNLWGLIWTSIWISFINSAIQKAFNFSASPTFRLLWHLISESKREISEVFVLIRIGEWHI